MLSQSITSPHARSCRFRPLDMCLVLVIPAHLVLDFINQRARMLYFYRRHRIKARWTDGRRDHNWSRRLFLNLPEVGSIVPIRPLCRSVSAGSEAVWVVASTSIRGRSSFLAAAGQQPLTTIQIQGHRKILHWGMIECAVRGIPGSLLLPEPSSERNREGNLAAR